MSIQAGKYDVGTIHRTTDGVRVTLRDPESNQTVYPKTASDRSLLVLAETKADAFLRDCQAALDEQREEWGDLLRVIDKPKDANLWRDDYNHLGKGDRLVAVTSGTDQFVLIVRREQIATIVYEGWPPRDLPALQQMTVSSTARSHRFRH